MYKRQIIASGFAGATLCVWNGSDHYEILKAGEGRATEIDLKERVGTYSVAAFGSGFNTWVKEDIEVE